MITKGFDAPEPFSESLIFSLTLLYDKNNYLLSLYDIGNETIKILAKEINNTNDIILLKKYVVIIKFEELKNLHRYFRMFDNFEDAKSNIIELCKGNSVCISQIKEGEIMITFDLKTITNDKMNISLNKMKNDQNEDMAYVINCLNQKNKEIVELKTKINSLEKRIEQLEEKLNKLSNVKISNNQNQNIISNSKIIKTEEELNLLYNAISKTNNISFELLYSSVIDGENENKFKSAYLNKNDIIIFVETKKNKRFGGYAHEAFEDITDFSKRDIKAFLFSLDKLKIYKSKGDSLSIWNYERNSMDFGEGTDLRIFHKFLQNNNYTNQSKKDYEYYGEQYALNGEQYFEIKYLELYKIIFN